MSLDVDPHRGPSGNIENTGNAGDGGGAAPAVLPQAVAPGAGVRLSTKAFVGRSARKSAAFFLPHLRAGMRLLDCGCGPGSISADLAELVAPGELVGVDTDDRHLDLARRHAAERGLTNTRFEHADLYHLPFADGSFDAAFASRVLEHLRDPVAVMREVRRVLKPGGVAGVISPDYGGTMFAPLDPLIEQWVALHRALRARKGGNPLMGRFLRATLHEAGFARTVVSVSAECSPDLERAQRASGWAARFVEEEWGPEVVAHGLADPATIERIAAAFRAFGQRPDAFYATPNGEAVGWTEAPAG